MKTEFGLPTAAYAVSGEHSMIKAAAANGWIDERAVTLEGLRAMRRAGRGHSHHLRGDGRGAVAEKIVILLGEMGMMEMMTYAQRILADQQEWMRAVAELPDRTRPGRLAPEAMLDHERQTRSLSSRRTCWLIPTAPD